MMSAEGFSAPSDPLVGQIIQERYQIVHVIGRGAMGVVYEAQHLLIGRRVALKTMAAHAVSPAGVQRFRREAQAAAAIGNSHVVDVLDMGRLDNGAFFIVMEHLDGVDLGFAVALEERFSVGRAVHVLVQLCDALSAIHAAGIVHRDLKPDNIFLTTRDGVPDFVKVLDFGVCKFDDAGAERLTATGDTIGTPMFMAPEQVEGRRDCDHRADIYALGALLYFVLTGRAPFDAPNMPALFLRICHEPTPSLSSIDSSLSFELDAIVQRALSKDPNTRFSSCAAFKAALRSIQASPEEVAATWPGAVDHSRRSDYVWGEIGGGNATASLVRSLRPGRTPWFDIGVVGVGVIAVAVSALTYLVRAPQAPAAQVPAQGPSIQVERSRPEPQPPAQPTTVMDSLLNSENSALKASKKKPATAVEPAPSTAIDVWPSAPPSTPPTASAESSAPAPVRSEQVGPSPPAATNVSPAEDGLHFTRGVKRDL